jgi:DNA adenine methylase
MDTFKKSKTPFKRMGGKFFKIGELIKHFPTDIEYYVEPFVGSGVVFFAMMDFNSPKKIVLNDIDEIIFIALNGIKNDAKINEKLKRWVEKDEFELIKKSKNYLDVITTLKFSFLGKSGHYDKFRRPYKTDFLPFHKKLTNAEIFCDDFDKIIENNNFENSFFYLDPPYENSGQNHYKNFAVTPIQILNSVQKIKGRFILSYNDSENIRTLFKNYNIYEFDKLYTSSGEKRYIKELIITNF